MTRTSPRRELRRTMRACASLLAVWVVLALASSVRAQATADSVRARGHLLCGVNTTMQGFSAMDGQGRWAGLDVDVCRAIAAAVLGDAEKVHYVPLSASERFASLKAGTIDVLSRNVTITLERDASLGLQMTAIAYYDGQGFMVPLKSRIRSARQLKDKTVCLQQGSSTIRNVRDYSRTHKLNIRPMVFDQLEDVIAAYFAGNCDALTNETSQIAALRAQFAKTPADHIILPELIAKGPMGPMVRRGDEHWTSLVRWVLYGLIEAEELGITQANIDQFRNSPDPTVQRVVGTGEDAGKLMGLDREWQARAIRATGNYGEIFERNLGPRSVLGLPRGMNHLWNKGGLHYAPPVR